MRRWEKILFSVIGVLFVAVVILIILPFVFERQYLRYYAKTINATTNVNVGFGKAKLTLFNTFPYLNLHVSDLVVTGKEPFANDTLLYCPEADFLFLFRDLRKINTELKFVSVKFYRPVVYMIVDSLGRMNYVLEYLGPSTGDTSEYFYYVSEFKMSRAKLVYKNSYDKIRIKSPDFNARLSDLRTSDRIFTSRFMAEFSKFYLKIGDKWYFKKVDLLISGYYTNIYPPHRDMYFFNSTVSINDALFLTVKGDFKNWNIHGNYYDADYSLKVKTQNSDFHDLLTALTFFKDTAGNYEAGGKFSFDFEYRYKNYISNSKKIDTFYYNSTFFVRDAWFHHRNLPDTVKNISFKGRFSRSHWTDIFLDYANFTVKDNFFNLSHFSVQDSGSLLKISGNALSDVDLGKIEDFLPTKYDLKGHLKLDLNVGGFLNYHDITDLSNLNIDGILLLHDFYLGSSPDLKLRASDVKTVFSPESARLVAKDLTLNDWSVRYASLEARNYFLTLVSLLNKRIEKQPLYLKAAILADSLDLTRKPSGVAYSDSTHRKSQPAGFVTDNVLIDLTFAAPWIKTKYFTFGGLNMFVWSAGDSLELKLKTNLDSTAGMLLSAKLFRRGPVDTVVFYTQISNFPVKKILMFPNLDVDNVPVLNTAEGDINLKISGEACYNPAKGFDLGNVAASGNLSSDSLSFRGNHVLYKISKLLNQPGLKNPSITDMDIAFSIRNNKLVIPPSSFYLAGFKSKIQGYTDFNGLISYNLGVLLPPNIAAQALHKVVSGNKDVYLVFKIYGEIDSPEVSIGTNMFRRDIKQYTARVINLQLSQDSMLAYAKSRADSILQAARQKADGIEQEARLKAEQVINAANSRIQAMPDKGKNNSSRQAKRIMRQARRQANKILKQASAQKAKILRQAKQQADSVMKTTKHQTRSMQRQITGKKSTKQKKDKNKKFRQNERYFAPKL